MRAGLMHRVVFLQRGSRLCPLGSARRRIPRASSGSTQFATGRSTALTFHWPPGTLQPGTDADALSVVLPPLGSLLLTPICLRNKATSTARLTLCVEGAPVKAAVKLGVRARWYTQSWLRF